MESHMKTDCCKSMRRLRAQTLRHSAVAVCLICSVWTLYLIAVAKGRHLGFHSYIEPDWLGDATDGEVQFSQMPTSKDGSIFMFDTDLDACGAFLAKHGDSFITTDLLVLGHRNERKLLRHDLTMMLHDGPTTHPKHAAQRPTYLQDCRKVYRSQPALHLIFSDLDFSPLGSSSELASRLRCYIDILEAVAHGKGGHTELVLHLLTESTQDLSVYDRYASPLLKSVLMYGYVYKNIYRIPVTFVTHERYLL